MYKQKISMFIDNHKIIRRLFLLGIVANVYFLYDGSHRYLKLKMINDRVISHEKQFKERMTARKYQILEHFENSKESK